MLHRCESWGDLFSRRAAIGNAFSDVREVPLSETSGGLQEAVMISLVSGSTAAASSSVGWAKDAAAPAAAVGIEESEKLAKSLQVTGTPSYVIGGDVVVGAVGYDDLQAKVANIKKCGKVICS